MMAPPQVHVELPPIQPEAPKLFSFQCLYCPDKSDVIFNGSSYCRKHYQEKLRTGK